MQEKSSHSGNLQVLFRFGWALPARQRNFGSVQMGRAAPLIQGAARSLTRQRTWPTSDVMWKAAGVANKNPSPVRYSNPAVMSGRTTASGSRYSSSRPMSASDHNVGWWQGSVRRFSAASSAPSQGDGRFSGVGLSGIGRHNLSVSRPGGSLKLSPRPT